MKEHSAAALFPLLGELELNELANDIKNNGQRFPIITWKGEIVDGRNRWQACQIVGVEPWIEERSFADDSEAARYVVSVNIYRRHLNPSQLAMLAARLEKMFVRNPGPKPPPTQNQALSEEIQVNLPEIIVQVPDYTQARDEAAALVGVSGKSVTDAKRVIADGVPELVAAVDAGIITVSTAAQIVRELPKKEYREEQVELVVRGEKEILAKAKEIRERKREERRAERTEALIEIAKGNCELNTDSRYPIIYADPPWSYEFAESDTRSLDNQYPTMSLNDICNLSVKDLATGDAVLFLWATSPKLEEAMRVIREWGFTYKTCMVWVKDRIGMGYYARQKHELLLIATCGHPPAPAPEFRPSSVIESPRTNHSAKPEAFAQAIEQMYPLLPKIELFCRTPREGWAIWGNQS